jgi:hypothetical protein
MGAKEDKKIAEWAGIDERRYGGAKAPDDTPFPNFSRDHVAISLLPILAGKDYFPLLELKYDDMWHLELWERIEVSPKHYESGLAFFGIGKTIHEAICSAVLKIINECAE